MNEFSKLDQCLEQQRNGFCNERSISLPVTMIPIVISNAREFKFGKAKKSSLLSNNQSRNLFDVGSMIYSYLALTE